MFSELRVVQVREVVPTGLVLGPFQEIAPGERVALMIDVINSGSLLSDAMSYIENDLKAVVVSVFAFLVSWNYRSTALNSGVLAPDRRFCYLMERELAPSEDALEGRVAFLEKRTPVWKEK